MRIETVDYYPGKTHIRESDMEKRLPAHMRKELVQDARLVSAICVETSKTDVVEYLDKAFQIGKSLDYVKETHLEIDESEIPDFAYFRVDPRGLELGRDVFAELQRPTCKTEVCPHGAQMLSPVKISVKKSHRVGIAIVGRLWQRTIELVISPSVKRLFDSEGITGLEYEPCELEYDKGAPEHTETPPYLARIIPRAEEDADEIVLKEWCKKHSIIVDYIPFGRHIREGALSPHDFQMIDRVNVHGKTYHYVQPRWVVSRKVLELLIKHKIRALREIGFFLGKKFLPLVTTPDE